MATLLWEPPATTEIDLDPLQVEALAAELCSAASRYKKMVLASSLQAEDMLLLDVAVRFRLPVTPLVLDTLRLHQETLDFVARVEAHYGITFQVAQPEPQAVAAFEAEHGLNGFYDSTEVRAGCCGLRKVEPLARALQGYDAWITGQRRAQAASRAALPNEEFDAVHGLPKLNPLAAWSAKGVWAYLRQHDVPLHPLYRRGYASIGCEPCTKAIRAGEDERAGRWWWENAATKECGLHVTPFAAPGASPFVVEKALT